MFVGFSLLGAKAFVTYFLELNTSLTFNTKVPLSFKTTSFKERENSFSFDELNNSSWDTPANKISLLVHLNNLSVTEGSYKDKTIRLA